MARLERCAQDLLRKAEAVELPQEVEERLSRYKWDPVAFCREVLGVRSATRRSNGDPYQSASWTTWWRNRGLPFARVTASASPRSAGGRRYGG